ncbi:MAG: sugar phosphate isomerase/epimerase [Acidobacteria bacterium]|nr:sugar phosphate isomerase/epimerase [Acidobacteriota bacterium]
MKIGLYTDALPDLPFAEALDWAAAHGLEAVEIGTGGFSKAPHCNLLHLLENESAREEFRAAIDRRGLALSALDCNGNPLDPHPERGKQHQETLFRSIELARKLDVETVITMSGCPGDPSGSPYPNWVTHPWQPEFAELHNWQWNEVLTPFWKKVGRLAADSGVKIAIEMHPGQPVHNTRTLLRLREIAGPSVGANLDPSHLFYQGMDPILVIRTLGENFIFHVHAKDTRIDPYEMALTGGIDMRSMHLAAERSWTYRTLGFGHGEAWWRDFVSALRAVGYNGVLSIEHEDPLMSAREGIIKSVEFLKPILLRTMPEARPPWL